jgi:hypothetical protein
MWRQVVIEAEKVEEISSTPPGITVPMRIVSPKHLEAWPHITAMVMLFEWTRADPTTI